MRPFLILGHRGSPKRFRENTIASLAAALEEGADGFETDLRRLADGAAVLFHDPRIGRKAVERMTLDELSSQAGEIAGVDELMRRFASRGEPSHGLRPFINLEVKLTGWEGQLLSLVAGYDGFVVSSFDRRVLRNLQALGASFDLGFITRERAVAGSSEAVDLGVRYFFPRYDVVSARVVRRCHDASIRVIPWSPDRAKQWDRLYDIGCDGMITDLPLEAVLWRKGRD